MTRIRPTQLGLWSFAVAIAHGAGLMLVPIYLGLCGRVDLDNGHEAAGALISAVSFDLAQEGPALEDTLPDLAPNALLPERVSGSAAKGDLVRGLGPRRN